ncbi:hypothetical protein [Arthrobacter bambusae]|uniref:hypothetical protein n=1 Tax=Arthrobacter bambusae TaxID=1338426 RepID=UPI002787A3BD|nr:hypothetical protein [Arthrobacter bambusae]MDQ0210087.1 hypothetical protein [Arthrobacter bambusae]MDQ0234973.1 hypothetical protein [Arthrobacter bambusae]
MTSAPFRLLRTTLIGSIILGLAAGGHLAGGGNLPTPAILTALCALTILPVAILTRARLSFPALAGLLGAGQLCLHWAFGALSGTSTATQLQSGHAGHVPWSPAPDAVGAIASSHAAASDWQMLAAHTLATAGTALVLARGEQALWALASWLRPLVQLPAPTAIQPLRTPAPCTAPAVRPRGLAGLRLPSRRGPPTLVPAA